MAHMVEKGGFAREAAWHKVGKTITDPDALKNLGFFVWESGMDHTVSKVPALIEGPNGVEEVPGQFHLLRDDGKVVSPATVTKRYSVLQVRDVVDVVGVYVDQGWATPDAAFSLYDGQSDVITLKLDFPMTVKGDESSYETFMVVQNFHGRGCCRAKITDIRVVCHNTSTAAFGTSGRGKGMADFVIRHTGSMKDKLERARQTWEEAREYLKRKAEILGLFADVTCDVEDTVKGILGVDENSSTRAKNQAEEIISRVHYTEGAPAGSLLAVWNGFTSYTSHFRGGKAGKSENGILESQLNGGRLALEQKAVNRLMVMAGVTL